jgi:hypothetical protein
MESDALTPLRSTSPGSRGDSPANDRIPVWLAAVAGALIGALFARAFAHHVGITGAAPKADVVGWLATPGAAARKSFELASFVLAVFCVPAIASLTAAVAARVARRGATAGVLVAAGSLFTAIVAAAPWLQTADSPPGHDLLLATGCMLAGFGVATSWNVAARFAAARRDTFADLGALAYLGAAILGVSLFLLAIGPHVPFEYGLRDSVMRCAAIVAAGTAVILGSWFTLAACLAVEPRIIAPAFRHFVWLLGARLAPENGRLIALVVAVALGGFAYEIWKLHRTDRAANRLDGVRFVERWFLPLLVLTLVFHRDVRGPIDLFHTGESVTPALEVLRGELPFRDLYLQHGLGQNLLRSLLAFAMFEPTLEVERLAMNASIALTHVAFFVLARIVLGSAGIAFVLALFLSTPEIVFDPRFALAFCALACIATYVHEPSRGGYVTASGVLCVLAGLYSVDIGAFTLVAILAFLVLDGAASRAIIKKFVAGAATAAILACVVALGFGVLPEFVRNITLQVSLQLSVWALPFPSLATVLAQGETLPNGQAVSWLLSPTLLSLAAVVTYLSIPTARCVAGFASTATPQWRLQTLIALAGLVTYRSALGRADAGHLEFSATYFWLLAPALALAAFRAASRAPLSPTLRLGFGAAPAALLVVYFLVAHVPLYTVARSILRLADPPRSEETTGLAMPPLPHLGSAPLPVEQARRLASLQATIEEHVPAGETYYDFSNMAAVYFLTGHRAPTRYIMSLYAATPQMQDELIADLEREQPKLVVSSSHLGIESLDGLSVAERVPRVAAYLDERYGPPQTAAFGLFAIRKSP